MNLDRILAAVGQGLIGGAVYVGGTAGYVMGVVGGILNMIANAKKVKPQKETELPEPTA